MEQILKRDRLYKKINLGFLIVYFLTAAAVLIYNIKKGDSYNTLQCVVAFALTLVPVLLYKVFKLRIVREANFLFYLFSYFTVIVGSAMNGYAFIPYLDKLMHFISGFLFTVVGAIVFYYCKSPREIDSENDPKLCVVFSLCFNMAIALLWEVYEYALFIFFGADAQNSLTTGVNDTMQDMIVCVLGGIIVARSVYRYIKYKKTSFLMNIFETYYYRNMIKEEIQGE